jgi:hypothetical protein
VELVWRITTPALALNINHGTHLPPVNVTYVPDARCQCARAAPTVPRMQARPAAAAVARKEGVPSSPRENAGPARCRGRSI